MKTFLTYLNEARSAPLYHGTTTYALNKILAADMLRGSMHEPYDQSQKRNRNGLKGPAGMRKQVSFTRDFRFAVRWKAWSSDGVSPGTTVSENAAVIEIDQLKLSQRYRIIPFNYFEQDGGGSRHVVYSKGGSPDWFYLQAEETVIGDVDHINQFITKIHVGGPHFLVDCPKVLNHPKLFYKGRFVNQDPRGWAGLVPHEDVRELSN